MVRLVGNKNCIHSSFQIKFCRFLLAIAESGRSQSHSIFYWKIDDLWTRFNFKFGRIQFKEIIFCARIFVTFFGIGKLIRSNSIHMVKNKYSAYLLTNFSSRKKLVKLSRTPSNVPHLQTGFVWRHFGTTSNLSAQNLTSRHTNDWTALSHSKNMFSLRVHSTYVHQSPSTRYVYHKYCVK